MLANLNVNYLKKSAVPCLFLYSMQYLSQCFAYRGQPIHVKCKCFEIKRGRVTSADGWWCRGPVVPKIATRWQKRHKSRSGETHLLVIGTREHRWERWERKGGKWKNLVFSTLKETAVTSFYFVSLSLNLLGWYWLIKFCRFPAYNSITHHLYIVWCVHHPKASLLPSPFVPPYLSCLPQGWHSCFMLPTNEKMVLPLRLGA